MDEIGLEPERLYFLNISAAMGRKFTIEAEKFTTEILQIGPNPLRSDQSIFDDGGNHDHS